MNRPAFVRVLPLLVLTSLLAPADASAERPTKPNVVVILADDLGWQDVGCYDIDRPCPFDTPNMDALAKRGVQFWQGYSPAPTCAPTRVAILSGKHPARAQKTHVVGGHPPTPYMERSRLISPWYSGRLELSEVTLAEALRAQGYATGAVGKWHCAINHHAFPQPKDQGFGYSTMNLGVTRRMKDRLSDFATDAEDDPYQLDAEGFPRDENTGDAIHFLDEHSDEPFFLYYAAWLVHTPIQSRSESHLRKYCEKMGVPYPADATGWSIKGQKNPYYGAMVEMLDHYVGQLITYLETSDDPRWPGHKLIDNTFVIFTSDNGGMERTPGEEITDNHPLDKGKIDVQEGGIRVPLIVAGPGIPVGRESHVMVNGLDFYPTILAWTGTPRPGTQKLDGIDLSAYLGGDLSQAPQRSVMTWHFPHSRMQSSIRKENYKLTRNWDAFLQGKKKHSELYQLHGKDGITRVDIEEKNDLAARMPGKAQELAELLEEQLQDMRASPPFLNPKSKPAIPRSEQVCQVISSGSSEGNIWLSYHENGATVVRAEIIYTDNGGDRYEEWYRLPATITKPGRAEGVLPAGTTHYVWNLIDENHFLVSHPTMRAEKGSNEAYSTRALVNGAVK